MPKEKEVAKKKIIEEGRTKPPKPPRKKNK